MNIRDGGKINDEGNARRRKKGMERFTEENKQVEEGKWGVSERIND